MVGKISSDSISFSGYRKDEECYNGKTNACFLNAFKLSSVMFNCKIRMRINVKNAENIKIQHRTRISTSALFPGINFMLLEGPLFN